MALPQRRHLVTAIPGPRSLELARRRKDALPAGLASGAGVYVAEAGGGVVVDVDGNSLIDLGSGIAVTTVGNSAPAVVARAAEQLSRYTHTCFLATPYEPYIEVAEALNRLTPGGHAKRTALFNTGAEAVENAVKYARAASGRPAIVVFDHAFHGRSLLTMTMTAKARPYKHGFGPFAPEVYRAPMEMPQLTQLVDTQIGADQVAAVVIEPIQGEGGFIVPPEGFLTALAEFCRERGILLVADEVQTGFGRTGAWFACEHEALVPDLIVTAKGLAGGMPLAAVTGRAEIMDAAPAGGIGGTYSGNPVACAAALGVIEEIETNDLLARARDIGARLTAGLNAIAARTDLIGEVRGRGAMIAAELVHPGTSGTSPSGFSPNPEAVAAIVRYCHDHGVLTLTAGTYGNVLRFLPPLSISDDLLDDALGVLSDAFATL